MEFHKFCKKGYYTIKRSSKCWCGPWTDMTIEQNLIRSMKTSSGTPIATSINNQIEEFSNVFNYTSEQHVDQRYFRIKIDCEHSDTITSWLKTHYPFPELNELISLSTGVVGDEKVNSYKAQQVGEQIVCSLIGENVSDIKLERMNRVVWFEYTNKTSIFIRDDIIPIYPLSPFQRIMLKVKSDEELKECLNTSESDQIVFLKSGRGKMETKFYSIQTLKEQFQNMIPHFMFIHTISGCDTTSSIFQQGKLKYVKTFQK
ncbi:hypothetical protein QTP88_008786 [Uroleucon formosanum]